MRRLLILLLVFCSAISGWTPVLAQIGHRSQPVSAAPHADDGHAHAVATGDCCDGDGSGNGCCGKQVHPMLCAACFAIGTASPSISRRPALVTIAKPSPQFAMEDSAVEPVHPPPKV